MSGGEWGCMKHGEELNGCSGIFSDLTTTQNNSLKSSEEYKNRINQNFKV